MVYYEIANRYPRFDIPIADDRNDFKREVEKIMMFRDWKLEMPSTKTKISRNIERKTVSELNLPTIFSKYFLQENYKTLHI